MPKTALAQEVARYRSGVTDDPDTPLEGGSLSIAGTSATVLSARHILHLHVVAPWTHNYLVLRRFTFPMPVQNSTPLHALASRDRIVFRSSEKSALDAM